MRPIRYALTLLTVVSLHAHAAATHIEVTRGSTVVVSDAGVNDILVGLHTPQVLKLSLSENTLFLSDLASISLAATGPGALSETRKPNGSYTSATFQLPVTGIVGSYSRTDIPSSSVYGNLKSTIEQASVTSEGGITLNAAESTGLATGGSLSLSNLRLDIVRASVYADVQGGNDLGSLEGQRIFTLSPASPTTLTSEVSRVLTCMIGPPCAYDPLNIDFPTTMLYIAPESYGLFDQALGLTSIGQAALRIAPFGELGISVVPEPGAWLMMGLGLVGIGLTSHRRHRATTH